MIEPQEKLSSIGSKLSLDKCDQPLDIESEYGKVMNTFFCIKYSCSY